MKCFFCNASARFTLPFTHARTLTLHYSDSTWGRRYSYSGNYLPHWCHISSRALLPNGHVAMEPARVYRDVPWQRPSCYTGTRAQRSGQYFSPRLEVWGLSPLLPPALLAVPPPVALGSSAPGPVLRQTLANWKGRLLSADRLWQQCLARGGCATPCCEFSQQNNSAVSKKEKHRPRLPRQRARGGRWIFADGRGGKPTLCAVRLQWWEPCQHLLKYNRDFFLISLKCNVTTFLKNENERSTTITNHAQSQMYSLSFCAAFQL